MELEDILYTKEHGVGVITLNQPDTLNAITPPMLDGWVDAIQDAKADDDVKAVVVTGAGRGFCSGMNVRGAAEGARGEPSRTIGDRRNGMRDSIHRIPRALAHFDKPYIAAVNGPAAGAGMDMVSMADIRFASENARFGMAFVRMARVPGDGGAFFLTRIVGIAKALELIWTGAIIDAHEALRIGYVTRVYPQDELLPAAITFARELADGPAVAIQLAKRLVYRGLQSDVDTALEMAEVGMLITGETEDAKEGPRAWVEKRNPRFQGR